MHLTQGESVWLLSSATKDASPANVSAAETPTPSIKQQLPSTLPRIFIITDDDLLRSKPGKVSCMIAWYSALLCICSISRQFHTERSPHSHFTLVSQFGLAVLHIVSWWLLTVTHTHTHVSYCHPGSANRELCASGKSLKFNYYSTSWVSMLTTSCGLWHRVKSFCSHTIILCNRLTCTAVWDLVHGFVSSNNAAPDHISDYCRDECGIS